MIEREAAVKLLITEWKKNYWRALAVDGDGKRRFECTGLWDKKGRFYINATVSDPDHDHKLVWNVARILADATRAGMTLEQVTEMINVKEGK